MGSRAKFMRSGTNPGLPVSSVTPSLLSKQVLLQRLKHRIAAEKHASLA